MTESKPGSTIAMDGKKNDNASSEGSSNGKKSSWNKGKTGTRNSKSEASKKKFQGATNGLEDHIFYFGKGMATKWLTSKEHLLNYIGKKYTMSEVTSLEKGEITLIGIEHPTKHYLHIHPS